MALMIFMQKWCWFHFPKYYSFILHYFFLLDSRPAPRASPPPCCAAAWFARVEQSSCTERRARGCSHAGEDTGRGQRCLSSELDPTCSRPTGPMRNQSTLDKGTGKLRPRPPLEGLGQQKQRETEPWMEWNGAATLEKSTRGLWAGTAPCPQLTPLLGTASWGTCGCSRSPVSCRSGPGLWGGALISVSVNFGHILISLIVRKKKKKKEKNNKKMNQNQTTLCRQVAPQSSVPGW